MIEGTHRALIDAQLGPGRVLILSRGYGNCRIASSEDLVDAADRLAEVLDWIGAR